MVPFFVALLRRAFVSCPFYTFLGGKEFHNKNLHGVRYHKKKKKRKLIFSSTKHPPVKEPLIFCPTL